MLGPLTGSLEGVKAFMKNVILCEPWQYDPLIIRKKWSEDEYRLVEHGGGKQLCFGIIRDDGFIKPHPPVLRAMETTKDALVRAGHKGCSLEFFFFPPLPSRITDTGARPSD